MTHFWRAILCAEGFRSLYSKPIAIHVGPVGSAEIFYVYEDLLRRNHGFFDTALKKEWAKGQDREVKLPEADVKSFKIWIKWLYTGRLFLINDKDKLREAGVGKNEEWGRWWKCYALGNFLQDNDFKDASIDGIIEAMTSTPSIPSKLLWKIYEHSTVASAHRRLAVETYVFLLDRATWFDNGDLPMDFPTDVLKYIVPDLTSGVKNVHVCHFFKPDDTCKYHGHGLDKPCDKTKSGFRF